MEAQNTLLQVAEVELTYKSKIPTKDRVRISDQSDAENIFRQLIGGAMEYREQFWVLYLNRQNKAIGAFMAGAGGSAGTVAEVKMIFQGAILAHATGIIVAHNHPSGNLEPSQADITLTDKLIKAGEVVGIKVVDHIIMTTSGSLSLNSANYCHF